MDNNNFKKLHGIMIIRKFLNVYPKCNKGMLVHGIASTVMMQL